MFNPGYYANETSSLKIRWQRSNERFSILELLELVVVIIVSSLATIVIQRPISHFGKTAVSLCFLWLVLSVFK